MATPLEAKVLMYARASKADRQAKMYEKTYNVTTSDAKMCAAIEIQRQYRGYLGRCRVLQMIDPIISTTAMYKESKPQMIRLLEVRTPTPDKGAKKSIRSIARERLQQRYGNYVKKLTEIGDNDIKNFEAFCSVFIGEWWKGKHGTIERGKPKSQEKEDTPTIPVIVTNPPFESKPVPLRPHREVPLSQIEAATIIQRSWRKHIDVQVFRYYRDLINFKQRGDPSMMLRCINPNEAKMLDSAIGVHIKFRLAGERFPPNIYYKIFTHRPIQDLCANSPKDYTRPDVKRLNARDVHNKTKRVPPKDTSGWYQRAENNGWRLVSDRLIHHIMSDPVTWETSKKKVDFHHNKLQRRTDIEKKKKQRKIDWMKKMYKQGMLQAKVTDPDTVDLIEGAAAGMVATIESQGPDAVQDWEVDELLDWTTSLNFDDYWMEWKEAATSATSEKATEDRFRLTASQHDPFELTVSNAGQLPGESTRQSHNTPVSGHSVASY